MASSWLSYETGARTERVVLPSRIRRGRAAVAPVWRVTLESGVVWQFQTRRAALEFASVGGCRHSEQSHRTVYCTDCHGYPIGVDHG